MILRFSFLCSCLSHSMSVADGVVTYRYRNLKPETARRHRSCIRIVDAVKLGQLETDHVSCGGADQRFFAVGVSVARDGVCRHGGVLLVHLAVNDEECSRPAIQPVVFF